MRTLFLALVTLGIVAVACAGGSSEIAVTIACQTRASGDTFTTEGGVEVTQVVAAAASDPAQSGESILVHYIGFLSDGTVFDSSRERGQPFTVVLGVGQVIQGWDEGLACMSPGEERRLVIPPGLAYGDAGFGDIIPPGAELTFEVELLSIVGRSAANGGASTPGPGECSPPAESPPPVEGETFTTAGVRVIVITPADEDDPAQPGDNVAVHYTGWLADGTRFDTSLDDCDPFVFMLGARTVIQGWEEGIVGMSPGEMRRLIIPPDLAYGEQQRGIIPPNAELTFDVELIAFGRAAPAEE